MSKKILVVDDEEVIARLLEVMLAAAGYAVKRAASGPEALEQIGRFAPEMVVLDVMMPEMDGFTVCAALKKIPETKDIKVVFLTARNSAGDIQEGIKAGGDAYLVKPFEPEELLAKISSVFATKPTPVNQV